MAASALIRWSGRLVVNSIDKSYKKKKESSDYVGKFDDTRQAERRGRFEDFNLLVLLHRGD